jgi:predicted Rossmann fold nucleotide-binding protein DprA/Smf involved in DNA uptake
MRTSSQQISVTDTMYPTCLHKCFGGDAPRQLFTLGNLDLLALQKTAFFCSARCPGSAILRAYDQVATWRDAGRCIIGGFHSPVERECLSILFRGTSPVIISPARGMPKRIPPEWETPLAAGRMLIVSIFPANLARVTAELAARRNDFVAALADEVWFAHITPGGENQRLHDLVDSWGGVVKGTSQL